ncbi:MAG: alpha/beta hydrolase [Planctomycetota bacterium]|jgi:hypothetical protein
MRPRSALTAIIVLAAIAAPRAPAAGTSCAADVDGSGVVDVVDFLQVLAAWGPCAGCPEDIDGSGEVGIEDFLALLASWGPCPGVQSLELAGRALAAYPFFDFVHAFNEGSTIEVAIDPRDLPPGGITCDVYVVAAKDAGEWDADPSLVDARGSPQPATFNGLSIQANTIALTGSAGLDGDGGVVFGVEYDVVCDVNLNGDLDDGDLIDGLDRGGFAVVHDTTAPGPLETTNIVYSGGSFLGQKTFYPTSIAAMDPRPLVVISHGNGHNYQWYDYLQEHLASYGYVVMSHQNNTQPGIESASTTTLTNTDYFLGNLAIIGGGVLDGRIDSGRITWIGHSRGGEGVARAYDRLFNGDFIPAHYTVDDIALISSIAPNDYLGRLQSHPHAVPYHLLHGTADGDNGGWPNLENDAPFHVFERAEGYRQVTHVHGADHNDFNCCGWNDFQGPPATEIGRAEAQRVARSAYLALLAHYVGGSRTARDFLWRQYETLRPIGVDADTIVDHEYVEGPGPGRFVIDDFQSHASLSVSSSGGSVVGDVLSRAEARHDDTDGTFTWSPGDPMNGMSRGRPDDVSRGTVFDWSPGADRFLEFEIVPSARDLTGRTYLTFRAGQGTRHPETTAELGDTSFSVTLRDRGGATSTIDFGAYGAGLQEPYQRTGSGSGAGWQNEYETIRIRLTDFLNNGSPLDLGDVVAVRFEVGASFGSSRGRVAVDDLALTRDDMPGRGALRAAGPDGPRPAARPEWRGGGGFHGARAPTPVIDLVAAQPFALREPYDHLWRLERPVVWSGYLLVVEVDPALVSPRQSLEPVLYAGRQTAERVNLGHESGHLVAIVPGDLDDLRLWFGAPALPEQVGATWINREHARATAAGIAPVPRARLLHALRTGGAPLELASRAELMRRAAELVERYSPQERELVETILLAPLP